MVPVRGRSYIASRATGEGRGVNRRKLTRVTQSRTAKFDRDVGPKYTESKRTAVKKSVTRRKSRKSELDEDGEG